MPGSLLGNAVKRVEDPQLLTGQGQYVDNLAIDGVLHLAFVRSPMAHAVLHTIDTSAALAAPGVVAAFDAAALQLPSYHTFMQVNEHCARPPLATDRVRFAGEPVAVVVAETAQATADAVELVDVEYDPLPAVSDPEQALADGAPAQFDQLGSNLAAGARDGDGDAALGAADVVVRARFENQRVAVVPMEGNAIAVVPARDKHGRDELTVYVSTQMPHAFRSAAARVFDLPTEQIRVIAPHVGGGFGSKAGMASEHAVAIAVARRLARPVKWVETRSENLLAMPHGRAQVQYVEMGFTAAGTITGMRCRIIGDAGAYAGFGGALAMGSTRTMAQGVYRIPRIGYDVAVALTNTTPVGAFRGAGRPEAAAFLERIMDMAAADLGIDPAELRNRNFLRPEDFPLTTLTGAEYDSGDYARPLSEALRLAGYEQLRTEQARRRERGDRRVLGIGMSSYVEITGGGSGEFGAVDIQPDGSATVRVGTSAHGQGHATSFAMLVADRLGIPLESITFLQSDTAVIPRGGGTGGSRSLQLGGSAVREAAGLVLDRARELAATLLEADADDIEVTETGKLGVAGVPGAELGWAELATAAAERGEPLRASTDFVSQGPTFPFGAHVSVVEVDLDTGLVTPLRHIAVDDCGRIVNPMIVNGQQHGGIAQGMAQALWEGYRYDSDGNPMTATLADYTPPTAVEVPALEVSNTETATPRNELGAKGIGESPTVGSTPAVQNAVVDALRHLGVRHLDMPCTPMRVWQAVRDAEAGCLTDPWREPPAVFAALPVRGESTEPEAAGADI